MTTLLLAILVAIPSSPRSKTPPAASYPAPQLTREEVHQKVRSYLGSIDVPIGPEQWRALGPLAADELEAVVNDTNEFPSRRARAVDGLAAVSPDRAARLVGPMARDENQPVVVRVSALQASGQVMAPDAAARELTPVMQSAKSAGIRRVAADVLSHNRGACAAVRRQASRESAEHRTAWKDVLERCAE